MPSSLQNHHLRYTALCLLLWGAAAQGIRQTAPPAAPQIHPADWQAEQASKTDAPVKIVEFFDYQCPFCASTIPALEEALRSYPGKVQFVLKHTPLSIHRDAMLAHQAALAAGEQGKFWQMHALLFANQAHLKPQDLLQYARQLDLDLPRFQERLQSGYFKPAIERDMALAESQGVSGTPTFVINGQQLVGAQTAERLKRAIDAALHPQKNSRTDLNPGEALEARVKNLDLSHSPVLGTRDAPVTIIEFSDMQCPYCASVSPTMRELMAQYPGQIRWIFKNFPLSFHKDAELAHRAVLAAGEQGKFWEMHDLIFAGQRSLQREDLLQKARSLGLDMARFTADLDSEKLKQAIESDMKEGALLNVSGTPTFYVNGKEYAGALSLARFKLVTDQAMASAPAQAAFAANAGHEDDITVGEANAPVTLTWFSDLQSDLTLKTTLQVRELMNAHPGKIKLVFRNRPLETHPGAMRLHQAALAANAQGKFWQMHDLIIANPQKDDRQTLLSYASRIGLDLKRFEDDLNTQKYRPVIERDMLEARLRAVLGTPVFFVNSARVDGLQPQKMEKIIADQLATMTQANSK